MTYCDKSIPTPYCADVLCKVCFQAKARDEKGFEKVKLSQSEKLQKVIAISSDALAWSQIPINKTKI